MNKLFYIVLFLTLNLNLYTLNCFSQDGSLDLSFGTGGKVVTAFPGLGYAVNIGIQTDGKIVYAGSVINPPTGYDVAVYRYNVDGTLDTGFGLGGYVLTDVDTSTDVPKGLIIQPDGKIVIGGSSNAGGVNHFLAMRFNTDGTLDTGFNSSGILEVLVGSAADYCSCITLQTDGKIIISGHSIFGVYADFTILRCNTNGTLDSTFDFDGIKTIDILGEDDINAKTAIQADGKIVIAGDVWTGADYDFGLVRLNTDGSFDSTFDVDGKLSKDGFGEFDTYAIPVIQSDGKIIVGGSISASGSFFGMMRFNTNGTIDSTFSGDGKVISALPGLGSVANSIAIQPDGKIIQAGYNFADFGLMRHLADGSLDISFGTGGIVTTDFSGLDDFAFSMLIQPDWKIIVAGTTDGYFSMARYNVSGLGKEEKFNNEGFILFPNPSNSKINLSFDKNITKASLKITNSTGQLIFTQQNLTGNNFTIDVSYFVDGIYFLEMSDGSTISRTKFIKE